VDQGKTSRMLSNWIGLVNAHPVHVAGLCALHCSESRASEVVRHCLSQEIIPFDVPGAERPCPTMRPWACSGALTPTARPSCHVRGVHLLTLVCIPRRPSIALCRGLGAGLSRTGRNGPRRSRDAVDELSCFLARSSRLLPSSRWHSLLSCGPSVQSFLFLLASSRSTTSRGKAHCRRRLPSRTTERARLNGTSR